MNISDLVFDYGWKKTITFNFQNKPLNIDLVFDAYKGEDVNNEQYSAYEKFSQNQVNYESQVNQMVLNYINENQLENSQVDIKTLLIKRDGAFGLLADCSWDIENGIAILLSPKQEIVVQDDFL